VYMLIEPPLRRKTEFKGTTTQMVTTVGTSL
jgi:hypothetical protein